MQIQAWLRISTNLVSLVDAWCGLFSAEEKGTRTELTISQDKQDLPHHLQCPMALLYHKRNLALVWQHLLWKQPFIWSTLILGLVCPGWSQMQEERSYIKKAVCQTQEMVTETWSSCLNSTRRDKTQGFFFFPSLLVLCIHTCTKWWMEQATQLQNPVRAPQAVSIQQ